MNSQPAMANFRDLGCLPTDDGAHTRAGILYRSDAPLPGDEAPLAPQWPPFAVIDLRSADEPIEPHPLRSGATAVARFPLMGEARPQTLRELQRGGAFGFDVIYRKLVTRVGEEARAVLELLVAAQGPVLIHCAAGKDRTGVLIGTLLRAAGVTRDAVIGDYVRTSSAMTSVRRRMSSTDQEVAALLADFPDSMSAPAEAIAAVLDQIDGAPGGVVRWLIGQGVPAHLLDAWRDKLIVESPGRPVAC